MLTKSQIAAYSFLGAAAAWNGVVHYRSHKFAKDLVERNLALTNDFCSLVDAYTALSETHQRNVARLKYLAQLIDANGIEIDEFDKIILTDPQ